MILRLVCIPGFGERERHLRRIRVLQTANHCEILDALKSWSRSSPSEFKRIMNGLRRIAENQALPRIRTVRRVGKSKEIVEIRAGNSRLFCFQDEDGGYTVICVGTFWIGRGNKKAQQNQAIQEAEALVKRWKKARPLPGYVDTRTEG